MRSLSRFVPRLTAALLLATCSPVLAAPDRESDHAADPARVHPAVPVDASAQPAVPAGTFRYGPIQAKDPEVRDQIRKLYRDQADLEIATQTRLGDLVVTLANEADGNARLRIQRDMIQAKMDLQLRTTELGLEIALLNGDEARVAEYQSALDRLGNPEKYLPQPLDPSIARERARQLGLEQ